MQLLLVNIPCECHWLILPSMSLQEVVQKASQWLSMATTAVTLACLTSANSSGKTAFRTPAIHSCALMFTNACDGQHSHIVWLPVYCHGCLGIQRILPVTCTPCAGKHSHVHTYCRVAWAFSVHCTQQLFCVCCCTSSFSRYIWHATLLVRMQSAVLCGDLLSLVLLRGVSAKGHFMELLLTLQVLIQHVHLGFLTATPCMSETCVCDNMQGLDCCGFACRLLRRRQAISAQALELIEFTFP